MPALALVPRTPSDWMSFTAVAVAAGICEESAYRGVGFAAVHRISGSMVAAAIGMAVAFAMTQRTQGYKTMAIVFAEGLMVQALVWYTGTLVYAMVGHALLDVVTAYLTLRYVQRIEREGAIAVVARAD